MHAAVSGCKNDSIKNMADARGEMSLSELFGAVDKQGKTPLFYENSLETVNLIINLDKKGEIACLLHHSAKYGLVSPALAQLLRHQLMER